MHRVLRPASDHERAFCEMLHQRNMGVYLAARGIAWDPGRFIASWASFDNRVIVEASRLVGLLRLAPEKECLGLRDLQVRPEHQRRGIGTWAVRQAQAIALEGGARRLQLRVYGENPAAALYARLGFRETSVVDGTLHMVWDAPLDA